jgi:hypothetical protein
MWQAAFSHSPGDVENREPVVYCWVSRFQLKENLRGWFSTSLFNQQGDFMKRISLLCCTLLAMALFILASGGCQCDDDPTTPPTTGDVQIVVLPDTLDAPWSLTGPDDYQVNGLGSLDLFKLEPGPYVLNWGTVDLWDSPESVWMTLELAAGEVITFTGQYTVTPDPAAVIVSHSLNPWGGHLAARRPGRFPSRWRGARSCERPQTRPVHLLLE